MKPVTKLVIAMLPVLLLIGCGSKEVKETPTAPAEENRVVVGGGATTASPAEGERLPEEKKAETPVEEKHIGDYRLTVVFIKVLGDIVLAA